MQVLELHKMISPMEGLKPLKLELDELTPEESMIGDPLQATMDDEKHVGKKKLTRKEKKKNQGRKLMTPRLKPS